MARLLILDDKTKDEIRALIERAKLRPLSLEQVKSLAMPNVPSLPLSARPPGFSRPQSETIDIRVGYRASFSIEEQPCGMCWHLSVSVDRPGSLPNVPAVLAIAEAFGCWNLGSRWLEEFEPGHYAINMLFVMEPREQQAV